jgi:hypothetical protein
MKLFEKSYCIDTDALITLDFYYPKKEEAFKAIWEVMEQLVKEDNLFTIKFVVDEIKEYHGDNFSKKWIHSRRTQFIKPIDSEIWEAGKKIMRDHPELLDQKKLANNKPEADPFLIALAYKTSSTIITKESKDNPNKIPTVASYYQIKCINLFEFFNEQGLAFVKK